MNCLEQVKGFATVTERRRAFIWRCAVLHGGLPFGITMTLYAYANKYGFTLRPLLTLPAIVGISVGLVVYTVGFGYLWGLLFWHLFAKYHL